MGKMPDALPTIRRDCLYFTGPRQVEVRPEALHPPEPGELLVQTAVSAISAGTEMLFYRNQVPVDMPVDATLSGYDHTFAYPLQYGYAAVGHVIGLGAGVDPQWKNRRLFAFQPHQSHFVLAVQDAIPVPVTLTDSQAALLPNMETAVMLVMDARPMLGERVVVIGLGVVGLLTTALLAPFPLANLTAIDPIAARRRQALAWGAHRALDPQGLTDHVPEDARDPDLILELSGNPAALDMAVRMAGVQTRIVVGSWYGVKAAPLQLGGTFHRNRITISSSQVSTIAPAHTGRWSKQRRLDVAWAMLGKVPVDDLISHRFAFADCAEAYARVDTAAAETLQVLFTYADN